MIRRYLLIWSGSVSALLLIALYEGFGGHNQTSQLPIYYRILNPKYLLNDWYTNATDSLTVRSVHSYIVLAINKLFGNQETVYLIITFLALWATAYWLYRIATTLSSQHLLNQLWVIIALTAVITAPGATTYFTFYGVPANIATALTAAAWYFGLKSRWALAYGLTALAILPHPVIGTVTLLLLGGMQWLHKATKQRLFILLAVGVLVLIASYYLYPQNVLTHKEFVDILGRFRAPWHYIPSTFPLHSYGLLLLLAAAAFLGLKRLPHRIHQQQLLAVLGMSAILLIVGYLLVEIIPHKLVLTLQLFRLVPLVTIFMLYIILYSLWQERRGRVIWLVVWMLSLLGVWGAAGQIVIAGSTVLFWLISSKPSFIRLSGIIITAITLYWTLNHAATAQIYDGYKLTLILAALTLCLLWFHRRLLSLVLFLTVILWGSVKYPLQQRYRDPAPLRDLYGLIASLTPADAIILAPSDLGRIRLESERALVVDRKASPFSEKELLEWYRRLNWLEGFYRAPSQQALEWGQRNYRFSYVVVPTQNEELAAVLNGAGAQILAQIPTFGHLVLVEEITDAGKDRRLQ